MTENHQGRFHASHVQTAPLKRRVLQYSKIKNFLRSPDHKEELLLVFSVTPFKIVQNKNQNRSIDKVQHLGNEKRDIYKDPHQDSGQRKISFYFYGDAMQHGGRKPTETPITKILRETPKHDSSFGHHVNSASCKSLEIQAYSITKPRTLLKRKFV